MDNNNNYYCTKCFENYNLLEENNEIRCVNNEYLVIPNPEIINYCKDSNNLRTEDKPWHSCSKCIENDILTQEQREKGITIAKITYSENGTSFCNISSGYTILDNCTEATRVRNSKGNIIFNCTKCAENNKFVYKVEQEIQICQFLRYDKKCMVNDCKVCREGNNYFCSKCLLENYEVNYATGSCVKKTEKLPAISWKDAFRLALNNNRTINSKEIFGPVLALRGISNSDISEGHAFLINLTFLVKYTRNLEENNNQKNPSEIKVPTICILNETKNEKSNSISLVDYYCIGNRTGEDDLNETDVELSKIEGNSNDKFLENSNFEEMVEKTDLKKVKKKLSSMV